MGNKIKWIPVTLGIVAIGISAGLYILSHPSGKQAAPNSNAVLNGLSFKATREAISKTIEVKGKSSYVSETLIYPPFDGIVKKWAVSEGGQVKQGDPLLELDDAALKTDIELQEANLRKQELETKLKRAGEALQANAPAADSAHGSAPGEEALKRYSLAETGKLQDELDAINRKAMTAQIEDKKGKLGKAKLQAPVDGIFLFADKKEPLKVGEQTAVGKIVDLSKLQLTTTVSEYEVYSLKSGMPVDVRADALPDIKLKGVVERISKFAKSGTEQGNTSAQFEVVVSLEPNDKLIAGLSLTGTIIAMKKESALVVPTIAVQRDKDQAFVYVTGTQGIVKKPIAIGLETAEKTEVTEGLGEGDTIVLQ